MLHLCEEMYSPRKSRGAVPPTIADSGHEDALSNHEHPLARPLPTSPRRIHLDRRDALRRPRMRGSRRPWPKQRTTSVAPPYHQRLADIADIIRSLHITHRMNSSSLVNTFAPETNNKPSTAANHTVRHVTPRHPRTRAQPVEQMFIPICASDGQLRYTHVCGSRIQEREWLCTVGQSTQSHHALEAHRHFSSPA
jgi:hypothetical protein